MKKTDIWNPEIYQVSTSQFQPTSAAKNPSSRTTERNPKKTAAVKPRRTTELAKVQTESRSPAEVPTSEIVQPIQEAIEKEKEIQKELESIAGLKFNASGFAWVEVESSKNFGYDGSSNLVNFSNSNRNSQQVSDLLANVQFDVSKERTTVTSVIEVGEMIEGDTASGGSVGGRQKVLEVRNFYLTHEVTSALVLKAGLQPLSSDPNSFIFSDHLSSAIGVYTLKNANVSLWTGKAAESKPGLSDSSTDFVHRDQYVGFQGTWTANESLKGTLYGVQRNNKESFYDLVSSSALTGKSDYKWLGLTTDAAFSESLSFQATYIGNQGRFSSDDGTASDTFNAHLVDLKILAAWKRERIEILLEGLATSGSSDSVASGQTLQTIGRRKSFSAPGASYILSLATSDGADDAPGIAKEKIIAPTSQVQGVQIAVLKVSKSFSDQWSGFVRAGVLRSSEASAVTGSQEIGTEFDISTTYELSPGTLLQVDYALFKPSAFFESQDAASLLTSRLKFSF